MVGASAAYVVEPEACCSTTTMRALIQRLPLSTSLSVKSSVTLVAHLPYSSDLVLCDWFLFLVIRQHFRGIQFHSPEDARAYFEGVIFTIAESTWSGVTHRWFERMTKVDKRCQVEREFIEKLD